MVKIGVRTKQERRCRKIMKYTDKEEVASRNTAIVKLLSQVYFGIFTIVLSVMRRNLMLI